MRFNRDAISSIGKVVFTGVLDTTLNGLSGGLLIFLVFLFTGMKADLMGILWLSFCVSLTVLFSRDLVINILSCLSKLKRWFWLRKLNKAK